MKFRITTDVIIENGVAKVTNTTVVPISDDVEISETPQGKQQPAQPVIPQPPQRVGRPAPVGQKPTPGKSDWFAGTSWGA